MKRWLWLLLTLAVSVASAGRLTTFAWDNQASWPPGTTVELCGNGDVCQTGITGTQATLDLPVNPGEVISAQARAVAPAGYQCGKPLAPCPHSEWETLKKTWPATPVGLWAKYDLSEDTVVPTHISTTHLAVGTAASPGAQNVTVPENATFCVVFFSRYTGGTVTLSGLSSTFGTFTRSQLDGDASGNYANIGAAYAEVTATGSQTITPTWSAGTALAGPLFFVSFYSGVDSVRDVDHARYTTQSGAVSQTVDSSTTDLVVYLNTTENASAPATQSGWTSLQTAANILVLSGRVSSADSPGASTTTGTTQATNNYANISIISLINEAASATALPRRALNGPLYGSLRGSVR